jgi:hypothetical protein
MGAVQFLILIICSLGVAIFINFFLIPYLRNKRVLFVSIRKLKKISKNHNGETKERLDEIIEGLKELDKNEKLGD